ncbi:hypothetical protein FHS29_003733 [Saccharothrix tamanrassetensis]|uniref:TIR domain-containing protein n=1 Tax=Saccharothrix tamanrassetensis TaxID=1051531 RepID=A0A841CJA5_9PSEU|nr:toll/interleukin-1 receptor domain-containing protein [Saccharothrix tamanrassetensis]MBB5957140.1 hypothetical protein [Saccharothrix tamanrassetensis]
MAGVFVNYRAKDNPIAAAAIAQVLSNHFGKELVFRDSVSMDPGVRYPDAIRAALHDADVLVAVVGPHWLALDPATSRPRIESENDWVRMEIAHALDRGIPIVPVLLQDTPENARPPRHDELPDDIKRFASIQAARFSQQRYTKDMADLVERLVQLVPSLAVPRLFGRPLPEPGADAAPSALLRPERGVVPFAGRDRELADLTAWAHDSTSNAVRLLVGRPGSGRRRLALELCRRLRDSGWLAGVIDGQAPTAQIRRAGAVDKPLLAVVADGELSSDRLASLAEAIVARSSVRDAPTRLLVLGRGAGSWLDPLREHRDDRVAGLFRQADRIGAMVLDGIPVGASPDAAVTAFAGALGLPTVVPPTRMPETVLELHALALNAVLARTEPADPLAEVLKRDRDRWRLAVGGRDDPETALTALAAVGTLATLCAPASTEQADALVTRLSDVLGEDAETTREYAELWSRLHPGSPPVSALSPDLLGEHLVAETLGAQPALVTTLVATFPDDWLTTALTVLGRALPRHPGLLPAVTALFEAAPRRIEPLITGVLHRLDEPGPLARAIAGEMGKRDWQIPEVMSLLETLAGADQTSDPLRGAAIDALLSATRKFTDQLQRNSGTPETPPGFEPLRDIVDNLTNTVRDFAVGALDPGSGRMPTKPDGQPILPADTVNLLRDLYLRHMRDNRKKDE